MPTRILHTIDGCDSAIHISTVEKNTEYLYLCMIYIEKKSYKEMKNMIQQSQYCMAKQD